MKHCLLLLLLAAAACRTPVYPSEEVPVTFRVVSSGPRPAAAEPSATAEGGAGTVAIKGIFFADCDDGFSAEAGIPLIPGTVQLRVSARDQKTGLCRIKGVGSQAFTYEAILDDVPPGNWWVEVDYGRTLGGGVRVQATVR